MFVEKDRAREEHNACGVHEVRENVGIRRCQQMRNVVNRPPSGRVKRHAEMRRECSDRLESRGIDHHVNCRSDVALNVRGRQTNAEAHKLEGEQQARDATRRTVQVRPIEFLHTHTGIGCAKGGLRPMRRRRVDPSRCDVLDGFHPWHLFPKVDSDSRAACIIPPQRAATMKVSTPANNLDGSSDGCEGGASTSTRAGCGVALPARQALMPRLRHATMGNNCWL
mmetsp:Transcript_115253/g.325693  ORF Transcript_115253/g.325693 Transcript_115253/m.325693 type:complete len:224 (+) Transcript_115253:535-1206(+)